MEITEMRASFRGKRIDEDRWVYGGLVIHNGQYFIEVVDDIESENVPPRKWIPVHPESVGQYTGMVDMMGRYIHEGDVVHHVWDDPSPSLFLVEWNRGCWMSSNPKSKEATGEYDDALWSCIEETLVIGNIIDNPELLVMVEVSSA